MEHDERMADKHYAHEKYKLDANNKTEFQKQSYPF